MWSYKIRFRKKEITFLTNQTQNLGGIIMNKINEVYKCKICNNIVEVVHVGDGDLVCCGQPMIL